MGQQDSALFCLKFILKVEPNDAETIFIRGLANELRQETLLKAYNDYNRALELAQAVGDRKAQKSIII